MSRALVTFVTHIWNRACDEFLAFAHRNLRDHVCVLSFKSRTMSPRSRALLESRCNAHRVRFHLAPAEGYDFDGYIHALNFAAVRPAPLAPRAYTHFVFINSSVLPRRPNAVGEMLDLLNADPDIGLVGASINARFEFYGLKKRLHPHVQSGVFAFRSELMPLMIEKGIMGGGPMDKGCTILRREIGMSDAVLGIAKLNIADTSGLYEGVDFRRLYRRPLALTHDPKTGTLLLDSIYLPETRMLEATKNLAFVKAKPTSAT